MDDADEPVEYLYAPNGNLKKDYKKNIGYSVRLAKIAQRIAVHQRQHHQLRVQRRRAKVKRNVPNGGGGRGNSHDQCNDSACSRTNIHHL